MSRSASRGARFRALLAAALLIPMLSLGSPATSSAAGVWTIRQLDTSERLIALTFDAGADRGYAAQILDTLAQKGVRADFGMTGVWAERNPDLMRRIVNEGHTLINHSWDHPSFTGHSTQSGPLSSAQRASQLVRTENVVREITGVELRPYFRPPYGDYDESVLRDLESNGYTVNVMWTIDTLGWQGITPAQINQRVFDGARPGAIVLMHVGAASADAQALPAMIHGLRARGYSFTTVRHFVEGTVEPDSRHFPQTGKSVSGNFLRYWNQFGGLPVFGYPLSNELTENGVKVQYFERARFELRPGTWSTRYDVHLGLLGKELAAGRATEAPFRPINVQSDQNCNFYPQTGHRLCHGFKGYWERFGGLEIFGYPISEEFQEVNPDTGKVHVVQYFERQRFEWHPGAWPDRYDVLLGRLGAQMYQSGRE